MSESDFQFDSDQLSDMDNKIGLPQGKLGAYAKAPKGDRNHVMEEVGSGDLNQLGFNKKLGV